MTGEDVARHALQAVAGHRRRSALTMLGILIGIASVILLTSIGEGLRGYILAEFTQFGTNLVAVNPGKSQTSGMPGIGGSIRPLSLEDAEAVARIPGVTAVLPVAIGAAPVERGRRRRDVFVYGVTSEAPGMWRMGVRVGQFLPPGSAREGGAVAVLGPTLKRELFGEENALGEFVRIAGERYRVIGLMASQGRFLGLDIDDAVYIPVARAMPLFNLHELQEIDILVANASRIDSVAARVERLLKTRHDGEEDVTVTTQTGMLETLDRILRIVAMAVAGIGGISLLVGAIGILTMMWISVNERTPEIGLAKAIGATPRQILVLFLAEAVLLSTLGGILGLVAGAGAAKLIQLAVPALPVHTPPLYAGMALGVCSLVGLTSGILPAIRASRLDPVQALAAE